MAFYKPKAGTPILSAVDGSRVGTADGNTVYEYPTYRTEGQGKVSTGIGFGADPGQAYDTSQQATSSSNETPAPTQSTNTDGQSYTDASFSTDTTTPTTTTDTTTPATTTPAADTTTPAATTTDSATNANAVTATQTQAIADLIKQYNLTPDQQTALQSIYNAVVENDSAKATQLIAGMQAAKEFSDPYFTAQITLATDSLTRALSGKENDLAYKEQQLNTALESLKQDTAAGKDYLSFQQNQDLQNLQRNYEQDLETTQNNLAATGFTQSSRRSKQEQLLSDVNSGMVQSTNRAYGEKQTSLTNTLNRTQTDTAAQIKYYQELTEAGKLDLTRQAEEIMGSSNVASLGLPTLGGISGTIQQAQAQDQIDFASSFVF